MSSETEKRQILTKRWRCHLDEFQRMAWDMCAVFANGISKRHISSNIDGQELFILSNLEALD